MSNLLTFEEFCLNIKDLLQDEYSDDVVIREAVVHKNNNVTFRGVSMNTSGSNISPVIYLESYHSQFSKGRSLTEIVKEIQSILEEMSPKEDFDISCVTHWETAKDHVVCRLVNYELNKEMLESVPHWRFLDLVILFYYQVSADSNGAANTLIHNAIFEDWGISLDELYLQAKSNTQKLLGCKFSSLNNVLKEVTSEELSMTDDNMQMYVLTNRYNMNGAYTMLFDNVIKDISDNLNSDLFILPSSVHELLIVPAISGTDKEEFDFMVKAVNASELKPEDILSDHAYRYNRSTNSITM